jgi:DHA1 family tetracycline resistance protein-like MFS transporter
MRSLAALYFVCVIDVLGFGIMVPLVPYMANRFGTPPELLTPLLGVYSLCQLIATPIWGRLSDRFGRRPILISSMAGACVSYLVMGFAQNIWWLLAARVLGGFMAGNLATIMAYASDVSAPKDRAKALGGVGAAIGVGFLIGPAIGGTLAGENLATVDFLRPALVAAVLASVAVALVIFVLRETHSAEQRHAHHQTGGRTRPWQLLHDKRGLLWLSMAALLVTYAQSTLESIFAQSALDRYGVGPRTTGLSLMALAGMAVIMQGSIVRLLAPRYGEYRLAVAGVISYTLGLAMMGISTSLAWTIVGLGLVGIGIGLFNPSGSALVSRQSDASNRGAVMGVYQASASLARVLAPLFSGMIYSRIGHNAPYYLGALIAVQAFWCMAAARHHPGQHDEQPMTAGLQ